MAKKIVSAGLLCLDITPVFQSNTVKSASELLMPGKLVEVGNADIHTGGSVANSGLAFQFFGADVTLMGKLGNDYFGGLVTQILDSYETHQKTTVSSECHTSYSIVLAPPGIDRIFLHYPGADNAFGYEDIDFDELASADLFHFGYPTIMEKMYRNNGEELTRMFRDVKQLGVATSLDMAAIDADSEAAKTDWRSILQHLLPYVDFFVPSVEELCFLLDRPRYNEWLTRANGKDITRVLHLEADIKPLADQLIAWGAKVVLIKCGAPGMYLRTGGREALRTLGPAYADWADLAIFERSYKEDTFRSATGAGDVSLAAFLTAAIDQYPPKRCLQLATGAGAYCVSSYDALSGLVPFDKLIARIDAGWEKLTF